MFLSLLRYTMTSRYVVVLCFTLNTSDANDAPVRLTSKTTGLASLREGRRAASFFKVIFNQVLKR